MKEIKVYMSEFPKCCCDCPCYDAEIMGCQAHNPNKTKEFSFNFDVTKKRPKDCPLIDIKTHDRELVKEVCEKIRSELEKELKYDFTSYVPIMNVCNKINRVLDQTQKEYEK